MPRQPMVVGNWKMNGTRAFAVQLTSAIRDGINASTLAGEVLLCPPFPYLELVHGLVQGTAIQIGGQNHADRQNGPCTGEVSASMLRDLGCRAVILGHSERRTLFHESDTLVADKADLALQAGLTPIVCLGETLQQRQEKETLTVIRHQLQPLLPHMANHPQPPDSWILAYEPVWAIGTGQNAQTEQIQEVHAFIRQLLQEEIGSTIASGWRILYGGSVTPGNAADIFSLPDVDGGLIGGASLKADSFLAIIAALSNHR
ncbi:MAG: triose-phosphate isomerase [Magnetococcales bacterium]|nr:triose-phosphate isomerase [Magnetococcales bacterium]